MTLKSDFKLELILKRINKDGLRARVDAKCIECIYDPAQPGTWVKQVKECTPRTCPLFQVRKGCNLRKGDGERQAK